MSPHWDDLNRRVVFGESDGRIIWQPRIGCWMVDKLFACGQLPAPYTGMDLPAIHRALNCSARLYQWFNPCFREIEPENVVRRERKLTETDTETTIETPVGRQVAVRRTTPNSHAVTHVKREVTTEDELRVAIWRVENTTWRWDRDRYDRGLAEVGDLGAPTVYMPRVTIQDLYLNKMGTQAAIYAVHDWPDTVEAYFRAMDDCHDRLIDVINASPIEIINFGDNVHSGTLPPDLFTKFVLPSYQCRCERLHAAGKFIHAHWDGDCRPLLPLAKETGLDGIEALTPKPQGDVTLEEIKAGLGEEMFLIDGIPALYFDEYYSVSRLEDCVRRLIELFAPKLVLGISDELSSTGDIERIRLVGNIVDEYNGT